MQSSQNDNSGIEADSQARKASVPLSSLTHANVKAVAQLEQAANTKRSTTDKIADAVSNFVGSMLFVYIHLVWFGLWVIVNIPHTTPESWHFDPYPFTFLTFVVSLEAIFLSTFILISQNHEEHLARRRNHLDLQINLLSDQENSQILKMLARIESRLDVEHDDDEEALEQAVAPDELLSQIEDVIETAKVKECGRR